MTEKSNALILLVSILCFSFSANVQAAPAISAQELVENAREYDGKVVTYEGEVIGDIMVRQEYAWINVRDESGAIGIFCPKELVDKIKYKGGYKFSGDIISVKGKFQRSCPQHGGDTDIHGERIIVIQQGGAIVHSLEPWKIRIGIILPAIAFALAVIHLIIARFR